MSDVMTDSEQVKAVVQGFSAWMPVISTPSRWCTGWRRGFTGEQGESPLRPGTRSDWRQRSDCAMSSNCLRINSRKNFFTSPRSWSST